MTDELASKLKKEIDVAEWDLLRPHLQRDALIYVAPELNLVDVGVKVANDDLTEINRLLDHGMLTKPTTSQLEEWEKRPKTEFIFLILQPYVLFQPKPDLSS